MSIEKHFCSSPWFHMRVNNQGQYEYCRWASRNSIGSNASNPVTFFKQSMAEVRRDMLEGRNLAGCAPCYEMEKFNKVSGRQRQLLKTGVTVDNFNKTLLSSPWANEFTYSNDNNGATSLLPVDWQIDLGNYCNSSCVFCTPEASSKIASEFKSIGLISELPANSWCNDADKLAEFVQLLKDTPKLKYMHFIGGETLITPAFKVILSALIDAGLSTVTIGFTTNLTVWPEDVVELLTKFDNVNVGMSIETFTELNDYVRWPSKIDNVKQYLQRWVQLSSEKKWLTQLRITPSVLTIGQLSTVYEYAWEHSLTVEACNFIQTPSYFRPTVLPIEMRSAAITNLQNWIEQHPVTGSSIVNVRDPGLVKNQIVDDARSYLSFLTQAADESHLLPELASYLKKIDTHRKTSVLNYLPEYEDILRTAGY